MRRDRRLSSKFTYRENELPALGRDLVRLIGWRHALTLVTTLPGTRLCVSQRTPGGIPNTPEARRLVSRLDALIGRAATRRLYAGLIGGVFEIPVCRSAMVAARNRWIHEQYDRGVRQETLCEILGMSRRGLYYILKRSYEADDKDEAPDSHVQGSLF